MSEPFAFYIIGKTKKITEFVGLKVGDRNVESMIDCFEVTLDDGVSKIVGYKNGENLPKENRVQVISLC